MTLLCITNQMDDFRSCTIPGEHTVMCDGHTYRWDERRRRWLSTGECTGCLPKLASTGMLCWGCFERLQQAWAQWTPEREAMMSSITRAVQRDTGGRSSGPEGYVPIPATILAVNEIGSYLGSFNGDLRLWVSSERGAKDAVRFARAVPAAVRTHELEEKAHKIRRTRCPKCRQLTLVWKPPADPEAPVKVECKACAHVLPQASFEKIAAIEKPGADPAAVLTENGQTVNRVGFFAEDYDPHREEHAPLDPLTALTKPELCRFTVDHLGFKKDRVHEFSKLTKPEMIAHIRTIRPRGEA